MRQLSEMLNQRLELETTFRRAGRLWLGVLALLAIAPIQVATADVRYFPNSEFRDLNKADADLPKAWADHLALLHEPAIFGSSYAFIFRLTMVPAFANTIAIRVYYLPSGKIRAVKTELKRATMTISSSEIIIERAEIEKIKRLLTTEHFWELGNRQSTVTSDGISFLLEVKAGKKYHAVTASGPVEGSVLKIARAISQATNIPIPGYKP